MFQPLDLTVNKFAKNMKFSPWFSRKISLRLENGVELDDIEVDNRLSVLKPLHAKWLVELYNTCPLMRRKKLLPMSGKKRASSALSSFVEAIFHL